MKKALLTLAAMAMVGSSYADGFITFQNFDKPIFLPGGTTPADASFSVGLFLAGAADNATPLATTAIFESTGLWQFSGGDVNLGPTTTPNTSANILIRAWNTSAGSFAAAKASGTWGEGTFASLPLGGVNPTPPPPSFTAPDMTGFQGFTLQAVPEPSTIALGVLGVGALLLRRRK